MDSIFCRYPTGEIVIQLAWCRLQDSKLIEATRKKAERIKAGAKYEGDDPMAARHEDRAAATMATLADRYLEAHAPKKRTGKEDKWKLEKYVLPKLGTKRVAEIEFADIDGLLTLLRSHEDNFVERKLEGVKPADIRKTVVVFANSVPEGRHAILFIGVRDEAAKHHLKQHAKMLLFTKLHDWEPEREFRWAVSVDSDEDHFIELGRSLVASQASRAPLATAAP